MASFSMEEFVGEGILKELIPKFVAAGWDDVPTLKMANSEEMDWLKLTIEQKDAVELRVYLHDRFLMQYADKLEASRVSLTELLGMNTMVLSSQFNMKRGHVARFLNKENACRISMLTSYVPPARQKIMCLTNESSKDNEIGSKSAIGHSLNLHSKLNANYVASSAKTVLDLNLSEGHVFKGIVATKPVEPQICGCIQPPLVVENVAPVSSIASISVHKIVPEYKVGVNRLMSIKALAMRASDLWHEKPTVLLCIRRPGCVMCRAEAHQLYSRKAVFEALGFQLIAVLHEDIESEVKEFWPRYWGRTVILDQTMGFFRALGGGKLLKGKFLTGFLLNPHAIANYKRAKEATEFENNTKGVGFIKGGMFIVRSGRGGIAYQFTERNFGDWAPIGEVIEICSRIQHELQQNSKN